jgi:Carboxypeptidase regulatory-like domain
MKVVLRVTRVALLSFGFSVLVWSQAVSTSQISGIVQDASGSAVPAAEIKATRTDTGAIRTATSGPDGIYTLPGLPVGPYSLEVTKAGFATYVAVRAIARSAAATAKFHFRRTISA